MKQNPSITIIMLLIWYWALRLVLILLVGILNNDNIRLNKIENKYKSMVIKSNLIWLNI